MVMVPLQVPEQTAHEFQQAADNLGVGVEFLAERALRRYLRQESERKIEQEEEWFRAQHAALLAKYAGQFVAMHEGKIFDADTNELALYERARQKFPSVAVLIKMVAEQSVEENWTIRSPRIEEIT
jgi:hypothetical protein